MKRQEKRDVIKAHLATWSYRKARQLKSCLYLVALQLPLDQWPELSAEITEHYAYCCILDLDHEDQPLSKEDEIALRAAMQAVTIVTKDKNEDEAVRPLMSIFEGYRRELHRA